MLKDASVKLSHKRVRFWTFASQRGNVAFTGSFELKHHYIKPWRIWLISSHLKHKSRSFWRLFVRAVCVYCYITKSLSTLQHFHYSSFPHRYDHSIYPEPLSRLLSHLERKAAWFGCLSLSLLAKAFFAHLSSLWCKNINQAIGTKSQRLLRSSMTSVPLVQSKT